MVKRMNKRGAGYLMPAEYYNPTATQPEATGAAISSDPSPGWVRPPIVATSIVSPASVGSGGARRTRRTRKVGGFAPAVMGSFVANAQTAVVPLVLYGLYQMLGLKTSVHTNSTRRNNTKQ
jgi:hypothetical protein